MKFNRIAAGSSNPLRHYLAETNFIESEFTQWCAFFAVSQADHPLPALEGADFGAPYVSPQETGLLIPSHRVSWSRGDTAAEARLFEVDERV